jgi:hypothetical protein
VAQPIAQSQTAAGRSVSVDVTSIAVTRRAPRWPFLAATGVALAALAVVLIGPDVSRAWSHHQNVADAQHLRAATAAAARVRLPASYTPTDRLGGEPCGDPALDAAGERCWLVTTAPTQTTPVLAAALRSVGLSPQAPFCENLGGQLVGQRTTCRVTASVKGWDVELIAIPNVKFAKLVRPKPGHRFVPPKSHIDGTEVTLSVDPH